MRTVLLISTCLLVGACNPTYTQTAKSPDQMLDEQDALAIEQEKKSKEHASYADTGGDTTTASEKAAMFDKKHTEMEVNRAVRSAITCPGVSGEGPYGEAMVTMTFLNDGHVAADKTTISAPFAGTGNGDCVLRAMNAIITKNFEGPPVTQEVPIKLEQAVAPTPAKDAKSKKK